MIPNNITKTLLSNGFGFGNDEKPGFDELAAEVGDKHIAAAEGAILSGHVIVPVSKTDDGKDVVDDGCGDGREVSLVSQSGATLKTSLHRPKVFGGGVMMTVASRIGLGVEDHDELELAFDDAMRLLDEHGVDYGAHTDTHASSSQSGCGAIDNAPIILRNIVKFRENISQTLLGLNLGFSEGDIKTVLDNFEAVAQRTAGRQYESKKVVDSIVDRGKVIKKLDGAHKELFVLLNMIPGTTADQGLIRSVTEGKAQLFDVDVWRLRVINSALYEIDTDQHTALLSELVYTLGTAATLTRGDLPVYLAKPVAN